jgi:O-antigen ligase
MISRPDYFIVDATLPIARSERAQQVAAALTKLLFYCFTALLLFAPLALGSVEPWARFVLEAGAALLALFWMLREACSPRLTIVSSQLFAPALAIGCVIAMQVVLRRSAYPYVTWDQALLFVAYGLLLFLAGQIVSTEEFARMFATAIALFGSAVALFAVIQDFTANGAVYWIIQPQERSLIFGPYVNRNHYAGLMEMLTPIPLVIAVLCDFTPGKRALMAFAAVLMGSTVFLSLSRGGMMAFGVELLLLGIYFLRGRETRRAAIPLGIACTLMFGFMLWVGAQHIFQRISSIEPIGLSNETRLTVATDSLRMIAERPLLGWGLGVFPIVYPQYQSFYSAKLMNAAHDDYVQAAVEIGLVGFTILLWFVYRLYAGTLRVLRDSPVNIASALRLGALVSCTGLLAHGFVDFNFQIPANAALWCALAGIAASET